FTLVPVHAGAGSRSGAQGPGRRGNRPPTHFDRIRLFAPLSPGQKSKKSPSEVSGHSSRGTLRSSSRRSTEWDKIPFRLDEVSPSTAKRNISGCQTKEWAAASPDGRHAASSASPWPG